MNFLNALEKIGGFIEQERKKRDEIIKDIPVLKDVVEGVWSKENKLAELKAGLSGLERQIQLSMSTKDSNVDATESESLSAAEDKSRGKETKNLKHKT